MADTAFQIQYRQEFIQTFEQHQSLLREVVLTEVVIKGNQATFIVAGSGSASATTRSVNGMIPARSDSMTQTTCTLVEWHDLVRKTEFNIFASQGNQRALMQMTTMAVINRKIDELIITELNTGTITIGSSSTTPNISLFQNGVVKLANASVQEDGFRTLLCQPSFLAYLEQAPEFAKADWVDMRPYAGDNASWKDRKGAYRWRSTLIMVHPNLPGKGTSSEKSFMFHRTAIGHAMGTDGVDTALGYNEEHQYSFA
jgi:hypothetical protein